MKSYAPLQAANMKQHDASSRGMVQQDNRPGTVQAKAMNSAISGAVVQRMGDGKEEDTGLNGANSKFLMEKLDKYLPYKDKGALARTNKLNNTLLKPELDAMKPIPPRNMNNISNDALGIITQQLPIKDVKNLSLVNKHLQNQTQDMPSGEKSGNKNVTILDKKKEFKLKKEQEALKLLNKMKKKEAKNARNKRNREERNGEKFSNRKK